MTWWPSDRPKSTPPSAPTSPPPGALDSLGSPLTPALAESPDQAAALYDALVELRRTFETDVASLLDITVGFSDTDGDSG